MGIEPVEIQHVELRRRLFGYQPRAVERLLEEVTSSFEEVWFERDALREETARLRDECDRTRERDRAAGDILLTARRLADKHLAQARKQAEAIVSQAREQAERIVENARREPLRLQEEIGRLESMEHALRERYRAFLSGAQRLLEENVGADGGREGVGAPPSSLPG
jgi:cell division septum initiation protein DivIVA